MYLIKCYLIIVYEKRKKERKREYNEKKRERENTTGRRENANIMNSIGPQRVGQRELQWMHPTTGGREKENPSSFNMDPSPSPDFLFFNTMKHFPLPNSLTQPHIVYALTHSRLEPAYTGLEIIAKYFIGRD